jgi:hypothetical protein
VPEHVAAATLQLGNQGQLLLERAQSMQNMVRVDAPNSRHIRVRRVSNNNLLIM